MDTNDLLQPEHRTALRYLQFLMGLAILGGSVVLLFLPIAWLNAIPNLSQSRHLNMLAYVTLGISAVVFVSLKILEYSGDFEIHRRAGTATWMLIAVAATAYLPPPFSFPSVVLCFMSAAMFAARWLLEPMSDQEKTPPIRAKYRHAVVSWIFFIAFGLLGLIHAKRIIMTFRFD